MSTVRVGAAGGLAAFGGSLALAGASGGFFPVSWNIGALVAAWIGLLALLLLGGARPGPYGAALLGALGVLAGWTALSAVWSESTPSSLEEAQRLLLYLVAAAAVLCSGRRVAPGWVAAGVLAAATVTAGWNLVTRWGAGADTGANAGPIGYANGLALLAVVGLLVALGFVRSRPEALVPIGVLLAVTVLAQSTGAWAALAAGLVVLGLLRSRLSGRGVVAAAAVPAAAAAAVAPWLLRGHERTAYWRVALHEIAARPLLGSGAATYDQWWLRLRTTTVQTRDAHSLYLQTLGELGPLGLAAVVAVLLVPLVAALRLRREPHAAAAGAAVAAYAVGAAVDFDWQLAAVTVPVLLLGASLAATAGGEQEPLRLPMRLAASAGLLVAGVLAALALAGNAPLGRAADSLSSGRFAAAVAEARTAVRWAPWSSQAWLELGRAQLALGDRAGAREAFHSAAARDPRDWSVWLALAQASRGEPRRRALARAARLNPLYR